MMFLVWSCILIFCVGTATCQHYEPNWESLDTRPLPKWFDQSKIGILLTWGLYSIPGYSSEWFWNQWVTGQPDVVNFMKENYKPNFTYQDFARDYTTEFYDPYQWAEIFNASGARYVVLITKHHDGFTNWPSNVSWNWNSMDVGPKRDLVGELRDAIKNKTDIHFGLYHSLFEWFNPLFLRDQANNFTTQDFIRTKTMPELYELVNAYEPEVIWSDGEWMANDTYWNSTEFLAWLYNYSPVKDTVVVNDRWGKNVNCKHGDFFDCGDKYNPGTLQPHKWESANSIDTKSWGYRRDVVLSDLMTIDEIIDLMTRTISCGGNFLISIGPTKEGTIVPIFQERLLQMGTWLQINGHAIYETVPWKYQNDTVTHNVWYTSKAANVFAIVSDWPETNLTLGHPIPTPQTVVTMLGMTGHFAWEAIPSGGIHIKIPKLSINDLPCLWSWVFKLTYLET